METMLNLRKLLILIEFPILYDAVYYPLLQHVLYKALSIKGAIKNKFEEWMKSYPKERFKILVQNLQTGVALIVKFVKKNKFRFARRKRNRNCRNSAAC